MKTILVTGSGRGIGAAIASEFLASGALVVGISLEEDHDVTGSRKRYRAYHGDVTDHRFVAGVIDDVHRVTGPIDVLVNNAGVHPRQTPIDEVSDADLRSLLEVNLIAVFRLCRMLLPDLRSRRGSIINIGSSSGLHGQDGSVAYSATKGALASLTKSLAIDEGAHGVRVNCVAPGAIASPATDRDHTEAEQRDIARWSVLGRMGTLAEVAKTVVFLASDDASFITGQDVVVSGGANVGYGLRVHSTPAVIS